MADSSKLLLPRLQRALAAHADKFSTMTYWRYANGLFPPFVHLLVEHPDLAQALADDAKALAEQRAQTQPELTNA